jgi:hypothetical protein
MRPELPVPKTRRDPGGHTPSEGGSYKLTVRSAEDFWAASVRIFDFGFAVDFQFRISSFGFRISSQLFGPDSWLCFT